MSQHQHQEPFLLDLRRSSAPVTPPAPVLGSAAKLQDALKGLRERYNVCIQPAAPGAADQRPSLSAGTVLREVDARIAEIRKMLTQAVARESEDAARWRWLVEGAQGREQQAFVAWLRAAVDIDVVNAKADELRAEQQALCDALVKANKGR